ncbi:hypothetical protein ACFQY8_04035 [Alloscardovia venturai]|uniref:Membrane associated protein n=1 Tax=Alloscardovia venturai TaxID=1769421 RepID=A0ABW2Y6Q7_9BIFI
MTNSHLSKSQENEQNFSSDDALWQEFVSSHEDDLRSVENSRAAKKFTKKAHRIDKEEKRKDGQEEKYQHKLSVKDFDSQAFTSNTQPTRGYSISWLDADDMSNHFQAPQPQKGTAQLSIVIGAVMIIIGFIAIFVSFMAIPFAQLIAAVGGIVLLIGFALIGVSRKSLSRDKRDHNARSDSAIV